MNRRPFVPDKEQIPIYPISEKTEEVCHVERTLEPFGEWIIYELWNRGSHYNYSERAERVAERFSYNFKDEYKLSRLTFPKQIGELIKSNFIRQHSSFEHGIPCLYYEVTTLGKEYCKREKQRNKIADLRSKRHGKTHEIQEAIKLLEKLPQKISKMKQEAMQLDFIIERAELEYKQLIEQSHHMDSTI